MAEWSDAEEELLAGWAERASGYRWLHDKSSKMFERYSMFLGIPASVIAYLSGGTVLAMDMENSAMKYIIGTLSILGGILTNLQGSLRWKERAEKHRMVSTMFSAFHRNISAELALDKSLREHPVDYIRLKRTEFDRLIEQCPDVPDEIIQQFNTRFKNSTVAKPDITNGIHRVSITRKETKIHPLDSSGSSPTNSSLVSSQAQHLGPRGDLRISVSEALPPKMPTPISIHD